MKPIRLLPIVVLAACALLVLKTVGIVTGGGYTLTGIGTVAAQDATQEEEAGEDTAGDEQLAAAEAAAEALFRSTSSTPEEQPAIETWELDGTGEQSRVSDESELTEETILQRLSERRAELDALEAEIDTRLAVVEAAEVRIEERMAELSAVEARINALVDARDNEEAEQFTSLVAMYESMRASDAARIFNDLDIDVLTRVGRAMNPRKLGPIMAEMDSAKAQQLTILLAQGEDGPVAANDQDQFGELPQIVGQ